MIFFVRVLLGLYSRMPQNVIYVNTEEMDENTTDYINPTSLLDLRRKIQKRKRPMYYIYKAYAMDSTQIILDQIHSC